MLTPYESEMRIDKYDDELKPCPFCGGKATMLETKEAIRQRIVVCMDCKGASGGMVSEGEKEFATNSVIYMWNRRITDADIHIWGNSERP